MRILFCFLLKIVPNNTVLEYRKDPEKDSWRRSWDRKEEPQDEFWIALEPNYLYLMDSNLIDSCKVFIEIVHYYIFNLPIFEWAFYSFL